MRAGLASLLSSLLFLELLTVRPIKPPRGLPMVHTSCFSSVARSVTSADTLHMRMAAGDVGGASYCAGVRALEESAMFRSTACLRGVASTVAAKPSTLHSGALPNRILKFF